jgi:Glyoxalase-like domain
MSRGLDHVIHAVRDLDRAAELYRRLGFMVSARNRHPWGTHNCIIQFAGVFLELLAPAGPGKLGGEGLADRFGRSTQEFLARQEGLSFILLASSAVAADAVAFAEAGIADSGVLTFERDGRAPDGSPLKVAFSLAFARDERAPDIGFAVCSHGYPENFWHAAFQRHPNTASTIAGVVLVAESPSDHHIFLSAFTGERDLRATSGGISAATPRGEIRIMDPTAFEQRFGVRAPDVSSGARLAAIRFAVEDSAAAAAVLRANGVSSSPRQGVIVVRPQTALGATLVFESAATSAA